MKTPEDFIEMFERKTRGQNKTMQELANDFSNLLRDGPFDRHWLQSAFIAGYKAAQEEMLKYAKHVSSSGQMDILSPIPNDKRNFCRKGVVVMFEDLKRYTDSSQE